MSENLQTFNPEVNVDRAHAMAERAKGPMEGHLASKKVAKLILDDLAASKTSSLLEKLPEDPDSWYGPRQGTDLHTERSVMRYHGLGAQEQIDVLKEEGLNETEAQRNVLDVKIKDANVLLSWADEAMEIGAESYDKAQKTDATK